MHFILDARGLLRIVECEEAKNGVKLADLRDTQVLQVVQHTLCVCVCVCVCACVVNVCVCVCVCVHE